MLLLIFLPPALLLLLLFLFLFLSLPPLFLLLVHLVIFNHLIHFQTIDKIFSTSC
ncbi:hypothetical protein K435DRAFT_784227 [Dendrothele bispora CBS 962.96]|uniref:Uncharacterized protein n=1 Tax=Dendrothele bispora (strain CBS 962.96) TaxID=1314807 RepID=A0A4V4HCL2_DENBC|nr:hypothetical protein K435DRAFT_784227 [Dendrothele bispora CBS 962.96]